jgi:hypothetical protein
LLAIARACGVRIILLLQVTRLGKMEAKDCVPAPKIMYGGARQHSSTAALRVVAQAKVKVKLRETSHDIPSSPPGCRMV